MSSKSPLEESIDHYQEIVDFISLHKDDEIGIDYFFIFVLTDGKTVYFNGDSCPLCKKYYNNTCLGCPIFNKTKSDYCRKTPYKEIITFIMDNLYSLVYGREFLQLFIDELNFLKSLRKEIV